MNLRSKPIRSLYAAIAAVDASKDIIAAPGAGKRLVIVRLTASISVTAAQLASLASTDLSVVPIQFGVSTPVGVQQRVEFPFSGLALPDNNAFRYVVAAPGYSLIITGEYYIEGNL